MLARLYRFPRSSCPGVAESRSARAGTAGLYAATSVAALLAVGGSPARAQSSTADSATGLAEVVVTAERRESDLQRTPISIAVYQGKDLVNRSVSDLQALSRVAPDISFTQSDGSPIIAMRGISSQNTGAVGDPAVAVSTDGFYLNRPFALVSSFYDIERVEVLRGPQGTLNGRNATGGAINILTARPKADYDGYVTAEYGDYDALGIQGAINVPLGESIQTRVSFFTHSHDYYRQTPPQLGGDDEDTKSVRGQILFTPSNRLTLWGLYQYTFVGGSPGVNLNIPFAYNSDGSVKHDLPAGIQDNILPSGVPQYTKMKENAFKWSAAYDLDFVKLRYLGGYDDTDYRNQNDNTNGAVANGFRAMQHPITWNHELALSSKTGGKLFWQVGAFYFEENSDLYSANYYPEANGDYTRGFTYNYHIESESWAGFGQAEYKLTDKLSIAGGVRYTHDYKRRYGALEIPAAQIPVDPVTYTTVPQDNSGSWSKVTYQATLQYQVMPRSMVYAKTSTGYKSGGFVPQQSYNSENVTSYEIGSKNRFADNLLELNIAAHYENYRGQQVSQLSQLPSGGFATVTTNAGISHLYGVEASAALNLNENNRISASVSYLHARFEDFATVRDGKNVQLAGNTLPNAPEWSMGLRAEHDIPISSGLITLSGDTKFASAQYFSFFDYGSTEQKANTISNFGIQYSPNDQRWNAAIFVNNIENRMVFNNAAENGFTQSYHYSFYAPRTVGGRVTYSW